MALGRVKWSQDHTLRGVVLDDRVLGGLQLLLQEWVVAGLVLLLLIIILEVADDLSLLMLCEYLYLGLLSLRQLHPRIH